MEKVDLQGFKQEIIPSVSGKGILFKKISIPNEDCSNFYIWFEIINQLNKSKFSSPIDCVASPYQRDVSLVILNKSILVPDNCVFSIQIKSSIKPDFSGQASIDYDIFTPAMEAEDTTRKMVFISDRDRQNAFRVALLALARFFEIRNYEYLDNQALYNKIKQKNDPIVKFLQDYIRAYDEWYKFYEEIKEKEEKKSSPYELDAQEKVRLTKLIADRENALNSLQTKFDELQFDKFKRSHGLENVDGINL